jgi:hypothetical protein
LSSVSVVNKMYYNFYEREHTEREGGLHRLAGYLLGSREKAR